MLRYYTYRHVRASNRKPFYIGCATKRLRNFESQTHEFERAYCKFRKNKSWQSIANNEDYFVEIISEFETKKEALDSESFFIKLYGLLSNGGLLVNIMKNECDKKTGRKIAFNSNRICHKPWEGKNHSEETKKKISKKNKGKESSHCKKSVICLTTNKVYDSIADAAKDNKCIEQSIGKCCRGVIKKTKNLCFAFLDEKNLSQNYKRKFRPIIDCGGKEYASIIEAAKYNECSYTSVRASCLKEKRFVKTRFGKKTFKYI